MRYPIRRQSQLLFRRSYKPRRLIRCRPRFRRKPSVSPLVVGLIIFG